MTADITPLIAGNWKMNGTSAALGEVQRLSELLAAGERPRCTIAICPPATLLAPLNAIAAPSGIVTGGQDCHPAPNGAHTGDISATMLADAGAQFVIVGHSERRTDHGESDELVRAKALAGQAAGLVPIICVGETGAERREGRAESVVAGQLAGSVPDDLGAGVVIAYEPVWAIGTGRTASPEQAQAVHAFIRGEVAGRDARIADSLPILYGGSVKPDNAAELFAQPDVDGGLVGGASLVAADFLAIARAAAGR